MSVWSEKLLPPSRGWSSLLTQPVGPTHGSHNCVSRVGRTNLPVKVIISGLVKFVKKLYFKKKAVSDFDTNSPKLINILLL